MQEKIQRNKELVKDRKSGYSYRQLMEKYGISENAVGNILARFKMREMFRFIKERKGDL